MLIYRIEDEHGVGPFSHLTKHRAEVEKVLVSPSMDTGHIPEDMPFVDDRNGMPQRGEIYGFTSAQELDTWFGSDHRTKLAELGFRGAVYEAQMPYVEGNNQVRAKRDRVLPIINFKLGPPSPSL